MARRPALLAAAGLLAAACAGAPAERGRRGFEQSGLASWYGPGFHGHHTANGEVYDMHAMTAAHKKLPFGTVVEVVNRDNGRRAVVRINDRGPFVRGRIIDLSRAAAEELGLIGPGIARVRLRVVRAAAASPPRTRWAAERGGRGYWVQAGAFRERERARSRLAAVERLAGRARLDSTDGVHRVLLGPYAERRAAERAAARLAAGGIEALVRPVGGSP